MEQSWSYLQASLVAKCRPRQQLEWSISQQVYAVRRTVHYTPSAFRHHRPAAVNQRSATFYYALGPTVTRRRSLAACRTQSVPDHLPTVTAVTALYAAARRCQSRVTSERWRSVWNSWVPSTWLGLWRRRSAMTPSPGRWSRTEDAASHCRTQV